MTLWRMWKQNGETKIMNYSMKLFILSVSITFDIQRLPPIIGDYPPNEVSPIIDSVLMNNGKRFILGMWFYEIFNFRILNDWRDSLESCNFWFPRAIVLVVWIKTRSKYSRLFGFSFTRFKRLFHCHPIIPSRPPFHSTISYDVSNGIFLFDLALMYVLSLSLSTHLVTFSLSFSLIDPESTRTWNVCFRSLAGIIDWIYLSLSLSLHLSLFASLVSSFSLCQHFSRFLFYPRIYFISQGVFHP